MAHTYMLFDLGSTKKKSSRPHKLESWKQAFRSTKATVQLEREQPDTTSEAAAKVEPAKTEKPKPAKAKSKSKSHQNPTKPRMRTAAL